MAHTSFAASALLASGSQSTKGDGYAQSRIMLGMPPAHHSKQRKWHSRMYGSYLSLKLQAWLRCLHAFSRSQTYNTLS
eukprot:4111105-Amphidinium_carterae.1